MNENNRPKLTDGEIKEILQMDLTADNFATLLNVGLTRYGFGFLNVNKENIKRILSEKLGNVKGNKKNESTT